MNLEYYKKYEPIFGSWYITGFLGRGSFGEVYEITREEYGITYKAALKIISLPQDEEDLFFVSLGLTKGRGEDVVGQHRGRRVRGSSVFYRCHAEQKPSVAFLRF